MIVLRKRLLYWLIKEYVKRWRKTILAFFFLGIFIFFILQYLIMYFIPKIPIGQKEKIGIAGAYTLDSLPDFILDEISTGLTRLLPDGSIKPSLASSWEIRKNGKEYVFHLQKKLKFSDGTPFTSSSINFNFSDVVVERPTIQDIVFKLKDSYAPFLVTVSKPIFKKDFTGVGEYKVKNIELNGTFVKSITLVSKKNEYHLKIFQFYPSEDALKLAFILGEVTEIKNVSNTQYKTILLTTFPNVSISKNTNFNHLAAIFYNTSDKVLSDKRLRQSLTYAIPDEFEMSLRVKAPFVENMWAYQRSVNEPSYDLEHAKALLSASNATESANLTIKTSNKLKKTADIIAKAWKELNINTKIEFTDTLPTDFQIFIGDFSPPKDPDQYTLWHSKGENNITHLKNPRIDKLLEDGRKTVEVAQRKKIYADFLKYLLDEAPASFLYFPYEYDLIRK